MLTKFQKDLRWAIGAIATPLEMKDTMRLPGILQEVTSALESVKQVADSVAVGFLADPEFRGNVQIIPRLLVEQRARAIVTQLQYSLGVIRDYHNAQGEDGTELTARFLEFSLVEAFAERGWAVDYPLLDQPPEQE